MRTGLESGQKYPLNVDRPSALLPQMKETDSPLNGIAGWKKSWDDTA